MESHADELQKLWDTKNAVNNKDLIAIVKKSLSRFKRVPIKGQSIYFITATKNEYTMSKSKQRLRNSNPKAYNDKMRVAGHPQDIIYATTNYINEAPAHPRKDNIVDFARGELLLDVEGRKYTSEVVIGFLKSGICELYDVVNLKQTQFEYKKAAAPKNIESQRDSFRLRSATNSSIRNNPEKSNSKNEKFSERDTDLQSKYRWLDINQDISDMDGIPAVELTDGSILPIIERDGRYPTHVSFIENNHIYVDDLKSGGWIGNGVYSSSFTSDTARYIEREKARQRVAEAMGKPYRQFNDDFRFSERDYVPQSEIDAIQSIGRKSVNEFSTADIKATERYARAYFKQLGTKSPFFRAWFGDWRAFVRCCSG